MIIDEIFRKFIDKEIKFRYIEKHIQRVIQIGGSKMRKKMVFLFANSFERYLKEDLLIYERGPDKK